MRAYRRFACPALVFCCQCGPPAPYSPALLYPSLWLTSLPFSQNSSPCTRPPIWWAKSLHFFSVVGKKGSQLSPASQGPQRQAGDRASSHHPPALPEETAPLCHFLSQGFQQFPLQGPLALSAPPLPHTGQRVQGGEEPLWRVGRILYRKAEETAVYTRGRSSSSWPACSG